MCQFPSPALSTSKPAALQEKQAVPSAVSGPFSGSFITKLCIPYPSSSSDEALFLNPKAVTIPTSSFTKEAHSLMSLTLPMILAGLLLYSRSMISMLFLGRLGGLSLAGGSLAIGFANITGYSVLSGLAVGMEPICSQAHGAGRPHILGSALRRTVLLLLSATLPISLLWLAMGRILLLCGQNPAISSAANSFIIFSLPDLLLQSVLHPIRIYLRSQSITLPLTITTAAAAALHFPINYLLVHHLHLGVPGVALSSVLTNFNLLLLLLIYLHHSGLTRRTGALLSLSATEADATFSAAPWRSLLSLAVPSCASVCLEWWWYEIMVLLCGFLLHPQSTVASMGLLIQATSLIYIFPHSLSAAVSTRIGNELGANNPDRARRASVVGLSCSAFLGLTAFLFSFSVRNIWATMFTTDTEIIALTASVLPILGLCELSNCSQTTGCGVLRGTARPRVAANINLGSFYGVGMPVAVWLAFRAGLDFRGLWLGLLSAQATCFVLMLAVICRTDWYRQAGRAQSLTGSAAQPRDCCAAREVDEEKPICIKIEQCS